MEGSSSREGGDIERRRRSNSGGEFEEKEKQQWGEFEKGREGEKKRESGKSQNKIEGRKQREITPHLTKENSHLENPEFSSQRKKRGK